MNEHSAPLPRFDFDPATRRLSLEPHQPAFVQDPYRAYALLHGASPVFFWDEFGIWCFAGFDDVSRLLRDRRIGRERPPGAADDG